MSLSGSYYKYPVSSFGLYVEWSAIQSITGNYSDITQKIYLSYYTINVGAKTNGKSTINGTSVTYSTVAINDNSGSWKKKLLYTHTVRVNHNSSGNATGIDLSASWSFNGTYAGVSIGTIIANTTIGLNSIDRTAPTVSLTTSDLTASGVTVKATASTTCDRWDYSTDGGNIWINFSTTSGTTASKAITGLTPNTTYNVKVRARKSTNQVYGTSAYTSVKTLGGSVILAVNTLAVDAVTAKIIMSVAVYNTSYTHTLALKKGSTTVLTITNLSLTSGTNTITLTDAQRSTILAAMSNVKSFTGTFELTTKNGSTQIGTASSKTATIQTTAENSAPIFPGFTYQDVNTAVVGITGDNQILIRGMSVLKVTAAEATAKNGATISSYAVVAGSETAASTSTEVIVGKINTAGTVPVIVTAIDSRGYTALVTVNITVLEYEGVNITTYSMRRVNEVEDTTQAHISGDITPIMIDGINKNGLVDLQYRCRKTSDSIYSAWYSLLDSTVADDNRFSFNSNEWLNLDAEYSYYVEFVVTDRLSSDSVTITIPQGVPLIAFRRKMIGVNKREPEAAVDVVGDIRLNGKNLDAIKQNIINAQGILKGYGDGTIDSAVAGTDYMAANAITSGSNANGSWVKYPDGTLIQWASGRVTLTDSNSVYLDLPVAVYDYTKAAATATTTSYYKSTATAGCHLAINNTQIAIYFSHAGNAITNATVGYNYIVTGRWKA